MRMGSKMRERERDREREREREREVCDLCCCLVNFKMG